MSETSAPEVTAPSAEVAPPDDAMTDAAQLLQEKIDLLLDRLTDSVMSAPIAGSALWRREFHNRDHGEGRRRARERLAVRSELARRAGVLDPASRPHLETMAAQPSPGAFRSRRYRRRVDPAQLLMF